MTEQATIARRAGVVTLGTLLSRVLGLVRDAVIAACFAVGATDAFFVAFTIPNALRGLLAEGAVSGAFVPVFAEVEAARGREAARDFFAKFLGTLIVILVGVTLLGVALAPWLVSLYAGGFDAGRLALTVELTRWVFPYIALMGVAALFGGALNAVHRYAAPAFSPALLNVALVAAALGLVPLALAMGRPAIFALALGVLLGGVLQVLAQKPALARASMLVFPRPAFGDANVKRALALMAPLLAGLGVYQVNVLLSRRFASGLPEGAQSYLYYAQRLAELPQGLFAFAVATATLPLMSRLRAEGDHAGVARTFADGLRLSLFVAIPSSVALLVAAEPIVGVLFGRGNFGADAVRETTRAVMWMAPTIGAVSAVRTYLPLFYAHNDTRSPVVASVANLVVFVGASLALLGPMGHAGIAAASSAAALAQLAVLVLRGRRHVGRGAFLPVLQSVARTTAASAAMGAIMGAALGLGPAFGLSPAGVPALLGVLLSGAGTFAGVAFLLRSEELGSVVSTLRRRVARANPPTSP